jgi:hypothetical protein
MEENLLLEESLPPHGVGGEEGEVDVATYMWLGMANSSTHRVDKEVINEAEGSGAAKKVR